MPRMKRQEKLIYEGKVEKMILRPYWDSHGDIIWMDGQEKTMKNKNIKITEVKRHSDILKRNITELQLYIDGERYDEMEITGIHGTPKLLEITGCGGAG